MDLGLTNAPSGGSAMCIGFTEYFHGHHLIHGEVIFQSTVSGEGKIALMS